jgi:hypothetical protein
LGKVEINSDADASTVLYLDPSATRESGANNETGNTWKATKNENKTNNDFFMCGLL